MRQIKIGQISLIFACVLGMLVVILPFFNSNMHSFDKNDRMEFDISKKDGIIAIKTHGQRLVVYQGEDILGEIRTTEKSFFEKRLVGKWNFFEIDQKKDNILKIVDKDSKENDMLEVVISQNRSDVINYMIKKDLLWFITMFVMMIVVFTVFITYNCVKKGEPLEKQFFYESFFCMFILFFIFESEIFQFFTKSEKMLQIIYCEMIMFICIPILIYIREHIDKSKKIIIGVGLILSFVIIVINNTIMMCNNIHCNNELLSITDTYETIMNLSRIIIIETLIIAFFWGKKYKYVKILSALYIIIYLVGISFGYLNMHMIREILIKNGLIVIVLGILIVKFEGMKKMVIEGKQIDAWECLAHQDTLTKTYNRTAYEECVEDIIETKIRLTDIAIISCDINNLKKINDRYGHSEGDRYLVNCIESIKSVTGNNAKIFRTGGDEFVIILDPYKKGQILEYSTKFERILLENIDKNIQAEKISFAYGYAYYKPDVDKDIIDTIKRADRNMYEKKEKMKTSRLGG